MDKWLVTGAAGFIGFHVAKRLLADGSHVVGLDNLNDYYDVQLKRDRLKQLEGEGRFSFERLDISKQQAVANLFQQGSFSGVIHLAAQAGVRYSLENPHAYVSSNVVGFLNILEGCRHHEVEHLVYASSSSVYGANTSQPFSTSDNVDHPLSLYAATKKSNELMAHTYSHLYGLPTTGLRFFTVYGPWGRPDMALFLFTKAMLGGEPIRVFNRGEMWRDFTYIDDIVEGVVSTARAVPKTDPSWNSDKPDPARSRAPYRVFNIGNSEPVYLLEFIDVLEAELGVRAEKELMPMQPGDVPSTHADVTDLVNTVGYRPQTSVREGVRRFAEWYRDYYGVMKPAAGRPAHLPG